MNRKMSYSRLKALAKIWRLWFWLKEKKKKVKEEGNSLWSIFCTLEVQMVQAQAFRYLLTMEHFRALCFITWDTFRFKAFCQGILMCSSDWNALIRHSLRVWDRGKDGTFFPPTVSDGWFRHVKWGGYCDWCLSVSMIICTYMHLHVFCFK